MFKVGEKVVCKNMNNYPYDLIENKIYTIDIIDDKLKLLFLVESNFVYRFNNFMTIKEYRKQKLDKLEKKD